jgi:hypothetical protein
VQKDIVVSRAAIYPDRHAVVMTSYPWELNLLTGQPAVQTPEGSFATLLHVACLTHAKYLQVGGATRSSLDDLARNVKRSQALVPLAPEIGLYEFEPCHRSPNS